MDLFLTDDRIAELLAEPKQCDGAFLHECLRDMKHKKGHGEGYMENHVLLSRPVAEGKFHIIVRRSIVNPLDFSVILGYSKSGKKTDAFILRRYNGKSHEHTNRIEKVSFYGFHIHTATERYQRSRHKDEGYAEMTVRYADFRGALRCFASDCGINVDSDRQGELC